jgi:hypothetical protein
MSEAYQFAIARPRALLLAGCIAATALLVFFAGAITGTLYTSNRQAFARAVIPIPVVKPPELPTVKAPAIAATPTTPTVDQDAPAAQESASEPLPNPVSTEMAPAISTNQAAATTALTAATTPAAPKTSAPASPATASAGTAQAATTPTSQATATAENKTTSAPAPVETSYAIPLAVRVGSFSVKSNADTLMQSLRNMGYQPAMSRFIDARGSTWYVVKVGPYTRWSAASLVATRISIAENVTPAIGPMQ